MIVYIQEQGAKISKEGHRLIVTTKDAKQTLFIDNLEQLIIFGNVQLTSPALLYLLSKGIDTVFLRYDGRYMGRLSNSESNNVFLRKKQFSLLNDKSFCLNIARTIVRAKLTNQATVMARIKRERDQPQAGDAAKELRELASKTASMNDIDAIRGLEGNGAAIYFKHFPLALIEDWGFTKRVRRPPTDPVNAVLSLLYTLLTNRCYAAVRIAGLDPFPAALHTLTNKRHSLPLDLVEEFRAMLADTMTIALFNLHVLKREDFTSPPPENSSEEKSDDDTSTIDAVLHEPIGSMTSEDDAPSPCDLPEDQPKAAPAEQTQEKTPVLLANDASKRVLSIFAKKMETSIYHPLADCKMTYNEAMVFQARQYRRLVEGEIEEYTPLLLR